MASQINRRQFLKLGGFITVSVATAGLAACGGSDHSDAGVPLASGSDWKFPQSVASGDPRPDSALLWTRVVPASLDAVAPAPASATEVAVRLIVSASDNSSSLGSNKALSGTTIVDAKLPLKSDFDNTLRHKVTGLQPGQTYFYQFIAGDVRSNVGRFKTAPAATADVAQLQFAYLTCQDWSINHWGALGHIAANESLDFIVHLGDYIYETVGEAFQTGAVESRHDQLKLPDGTYKNGSSGAKYATTTADYRYLYKKYRTDTRLQAVHERFAFIAIWDDHEFTDDAWQDASTYEGIVAADGSDLHQPSRRRSANQAWFEYMPADVTFDAAATSFQNIQIYRDFQFGKLMQLVMTDERLYRADHAIPEASVNPATGKPLGSIGSRYLVPQQLFDSVEAQKMAAATKAGADPLAAVGMLGTTQREWWKGKMKAATSTWKLWGNEVSLLRMGLNGIDAIATLVALSGMSKVGAAIASTLPLVGGNVALANAIVAASTAGATTSVAQAAAMAIAGAGGNTAAQGAAAVGAGLSAAQAGIAVAAFNSGSPTAAAQVIAFGWIKPDVQAKQAASSFVTASGQAAALAPFFNRFLLNCDQWDGYNSERKALMAHLKTNAIGNVVAITGDIHSFFAGTVNDDFDAAGGGTPVMVDLVSAGVSSDSFFSYMNAAGQGDIGTLVSYPLAIPVPGVGTVNLAINLLDYTMGKAAPTVDSLLEQFRVQLRGALAAKGVPEAQLDATVTAVQGGLKASTDFSVTLLGLAQQLSGLGNNPWLKHLNTDAQGYTVVTLTPGKLVAQFKQVNKLVGNAAPATVIARVATATVTAGTAAVVVA
ncbi:alkaline phosphatase D family protein [Janthinobacterium psychrotolerans]|uniref:Alkaline phosphatase D n=1 Tax=Janthinobacterium psychrotolerans TaxID=1747903 RepID=A0A1A7BVU0_9BURK|nr:alkaline phosphatase D family protein [Janthinobacterium psychrotolerans]OBV37681.1 alkaline phosphatase D [Janthinobacterium psychrotolerans]